MSPFADPDGLRTPAADASMDADVVPESCADLAELCTQPLKMIWVHACMGAGKTWLLRYTKCALAAKREKYFVVMLDCSNWAGMDQQLRCLLQQLGVAWSPGRGSVRMETVVSQLRQRGADLRKANYEACIVFVDSLDRIPNGELDAFLSQLQLLQCYMNDDHSWWLLRLMRPAAAWLRLVVASRVVPQVELRLDEMWGKTMHYYPSPEKSVQPEDVRKKYLRRRLSSLLATELTDTTAAQIDKLADGNLEIASGIVDKMMLLNPPGQPCALAWLKQTTAAELTQLDANVQATIERMKGARPDCQHLCHVLRQLQNHRPGWTWSNLDGPAGDNPDQQNAVMLAKEQASLLLNQPREARGADQLLRLAHECVPGAVGRTIAPISVRDA